MSTNNIIENLLSGLSEIIYPLQNLNAGNFEAFLERLGFRMKVAGDTKIGKAISDIAVSTQEIMKDVDEFFKTTSNEDKAMKALDLLVKISSIITSVNNIKDAFSNIKIDEKIVEEIPVRLLNYLFSDYFYRSNPHLYGWLMFFGVITKDEKDILPQRDGKIYLDAFRLDKLPDTIFKPLDTITDIVTNDRLLKNLDWLRRAYAIPGGYYILNEASAKKLGHTEAAGEIRIPFDQGGSWPETYWELGMNITTVPKTNNANKGLAIMPYLFGKSDTTFKFSTSWFDATLDIGTTLKLDDGIALILRPPDKAELMMNLFSDAENVLSSVNYNISLKLEENISGKDQAWYLFGSPDSAHLSFKGLQFAVSLTGEGKDASFGAEFGIKNIELKVTAGDNSFLNQILPKDGINCTVNDFAIGIATNRSFYIKATVGMGFNIDINKTFGPFFVNTLRLELLTGDNIGISAGVSGGATIGPLSLSVDNIGLACKLITGTKTGIFGNADLDFGFKWPDGIGLSISASGITGGGFLGKDADGYYGGLALAFSDIAITAVGIISTRMPDGSQGYSVLISIGVVFSPAIQLSFGFTLSGIGGLVGINRTMNLTALQDGIRTKTLDSILFPEPSQVIKNANKIISDLKTVFPASQGRFVIGPMIKFGWGSPNIITANVGLFIEIPEPIRIALMGQVHAIIPNPEKAIISINLDILGTFDQQKKEIIFLASLYDSKILTFVLYGDAAFLYRWGDNPEFLLSIGGFHPSFPAPEPRNIFGSLKRLTIDLSKDSSFSLLATCYQALTPNTLQFGAAIQFKADVKVASVEGSFSFDTLFYFSPFSFIVEIKGLFVIKVGGKKLANIGIYVSLQGPTPWSLKGKVEIQILFFKVSVDISATWGKSQLIAASAVDPYEELKTISQQSKLWAGVLPPHFTAVETLREIKGADDMILVPPSGMLEFRQKVVPLGISMEKYGNAPITGHDYFSIESIIALGDKEIQFENVRDFFASGLVQELSPQDKLSKPSFQEYISGAKTASSGFIEIGGQLEGDKFATSCSTLEYETAIMDESSEHTRTRMNWKSARIMLKNNSISRSAVKRRGLNKFVQSDRMKVKVQEEKYVVVNENNKMIENTGAQSLMETKMLIKNFSTNRTMKVVPSYESL